MKSRMWESCLYGSGRVGAGNYFVLLHSIFIILSICVYHFKKGKRINEKSLFSSISFVF